MRLTATLQREDFVAFLQQLTPLELRLSDPGEPQRLFLIDTPRDVRLVAGKGLEVRTSARLTWEVLGVRLPVTVQSMRLTLRPSLVERSGRPVLAFALRFEEADLRAFPAFLDAKVIDAVNAAAAEHESRLVWDFIDTLTFDFKLPKQLPPSRMAFCAMAGDLEVTDEEVVLSVRFETRVAFEEIPADLGVA